MSAYSKYSDEELVSQIQADDTGAFTEIYNRYWEQLLELGYYYTHSKPAAEDIVHNVVTSLWTRRADVAINSLKAYLATAVKFAVFKAIERDRHRRELALGLNSMLQTNELEDKLDARFLQEYLRGMVEQLPDKTRLVFRYSR